MRGEGEKRRGEERRGGEMHAPSIISHPLLDNCLKTSFRFHALSTLCVFDGRGRESLVWRGGTVENVNHS